ncbi:MAG: glycine cleavage system protein GcvH [bacterium]|nr:glycine cleavage system protein GcvH [bacterium]
MKPEELKYNASHEWVGLDSDGLAVIGITDFALEQLTDLVYMALPEVGAQVTAGEEFGEVESVKAVSPLYSPVSGEVVEVHSELVESLEKLGDDPFGNGWIIKVKLADGASLDGLLDHDSYRKQCSDA